MVYVDTPAYLYAVLGGALLGIATSINYVLRGKVTGMSGILFGIVSLNKKQLPEKLTIVAGMFLISGIFFDSFGYSQNTSPSKPIPFGPKNQITAGLSCFGYFISGLLVGFGTKLGNGCTSGHGLCGVSRLSIRSIVAVVIFLFTAIGISTLKDYVGLSFMTDTKFGINVPINNMISANIFLGIGVLLPFVSYFIARAEEDFNFYSYLVNQVVIYIVGIVFGLGLMIAGMTRRQKINAFLSMNNNWDPSLLFVLCTGVLINLLVFNYMIRVKKTAVISGQTVFNPTNNKIDWKLVLGAFIFGLGWGIGSLCPGPFLMLLSVFTIQISVIWGCSCIAGMFLAHFIGNAFEKKQEKKEFFKQLSSDIK